MGCFYICGVLLWGEIVLLPFCLLDFVELWRCNHNLKELENCPSIVVMTMFDFPFIGYAWVRFVYGIVFGLILGILCLGYSWLVWIALGAEALWGFLDYSSKKPILYWIFFFWLFSRGLAVIKGWKVLLRLLQTWKTILGIHWIWITSKISGIFKMPGEPKIFLIWNIEDYFFPSWFSIYFKTFRKSSKNYKNPFRMLNFIF